MADNVLSLKKDVKENAEQKVEGFVMRNRVAIITVAAVLVVAAIGVGVFFGVSDSIKNKGLSVLEGIENSYVKDSDSLTDAQILDRQNEALEALKPYLAKSGIVGVRANLLAGDVYFSKKDYTNALDNYIAAAKASPKAYTAAYAYVSAAVCCDELGNYEDAASYYQKASEQKNFVLAARALFNLGRVRESLGNFEAAAEAYQNLIDTYTNDTWANEAQSRLIILRNEGKVQQ